MKARIFWTLAAVVALSGIARAQPAKSGPTEGSDSEKLIGAWRLASLGEPGADGTVKSVTGLKGTLIYARDGHMSVQIMYPASQSALFNDYVRNGYEASFGSYTVNEAAHTVTHHVEGSITPGLVGKDLTRAYRFSNGHLIIRSTRPEEHWQVVWEHY
jgi:hypothetical protein